MPVADRHEPFRQIAREASLDAIALVPGANFARLYQHEFHQNERPLVVVIPAVGAPAAVVPNLELASFNDIGFEGEVFDWRDQTGYQSAFDALFAHLSVRRIGVEGQAMRVFVEQALCRGVDARGGSLEIVDAQAAIAALRLCKSDDEIDALREAIRITETALSETLAEMRIGMSEKAIENILVQRLFGNGADEFAFKPIVACGQNSARPHASARYDHAVSAGDALLIDFGGRYGGFCADITRTVFVDHCSDTHAAIYETVLAANTVGVATAYPGVTAHEVDDASTAVLEASPWRDRIRHKTGHGLGRDIHEDPYIMRGNHEPLAAGMVFTVEPGLYALDDIGIRIEDDVLVTDAGRESLTTFDRSLTVIA